MSARLRLALLAGSALILALELPDLGRLLHHDLFGPRPALASAGAGFDGARRVGAAVALAALGFSDSTEATGATWPTGVRRDADEEPR